jgi:hypothetical protein
MNTSMEIAQTAARLIVDEGLDYGAAKRMALKQLGLPNRSALPDNDLVEAQVREHIAIFCADTQPMELAATWMARLAEFRPYLCGSVWHGTATRASDIFLQLFCDDPKSAEIALIDHGVRFEPSSVTGLRGKSVDALTLMVHSRELDAKVAIHLLIHDHDDLRGALKPDAQGRTPRGDLQAVQALIASAAQEGAA